jgi:hypothetical protein
LGLLSFLEGLFTKKQYGTPSVTMQGVQVKSKAEARIADYFTSSGIRYVYEKQARADGLVFRKKLYAKPDFYLPDYNLYVEYWGLLGVSKDYERNMKRKMAVYHRNGIKFVSIYPRNMDNLDWVFRAKFREALGRDLPNVSSANRTPGGFCTTCGFRIGTGARFCSHCGKPVDS